jgi:4-hydroxy-2-oxoheptanedioate aldolase
MIMAFNKREFLSAGLGLGIGAGLAGSAAMAQERSGQPPVGYGEASKSGDRVKSFAGSGKQTSMVDMNYKPRRLNKAIELWEDDQPVFYATYAPSGVPDGYEVGRAMAKTWCDAINYEMEQASFDVSNLRNFMQGLVDGGPTRSGHRMPMVFASLPVTGLDATYMRANSWVIAQVLAAGVQSIDLCHARDPEAVEVAVQSMRYPFDYPGVPRQRLEGLRGNGSESFSSHIWGITGNQYLHRADLWPLNPKGELCLGLKIEDKYAHANAMKTLGIPGVCFAEWGAGDSSVSILGLAVYPEDAPTRGDGTAATPAPGSYEDPRLEHARLTVLAACKAHGIRPLNMGSSRDATENYKQGTRVLGGGNEEAALACREFARRTMPI